MSPSTVTLPNQNYCRNVFIIGGNNISVGFINLGCVFNSWTIDATEMEVGLQGQTVT